MRGASRNFAVKALSIFPYKLLSRFKSSSRRHHREEHSNCARYHQRNCPRRYYSYISHSFNHIVLRPRSSFDPITGLFASAITSFSSHEALQPRKRITRSPPIRRRDRDSAWLCDPNRLSHLFSTAILKHEGPDLPMIWPRVSRI